MLNSMEFDEESSVLEDFDNGLKVEIEADSDSFEQPNESFKCSYCDRLYRYKKTLNHHLRKCHSIYEEPPKNINCLEKDCFEKFSSVSLLREHLFHSHGKDIKSNTYIFNSFTDFCRWKEDLEKDTRSRFTFRSSWTKKDGTINKVYNCNRSGSYTPLSHNKRKRKIKAQGTRKIGQECPARLLVNQENLESGEFIKVEAILDHYGHDCDLTHISFSRDERALLQGKLAMGVPKEKILNEIKSMSNDSNEQRLHHAKSKDLCNILSSLKKGGLRQNDDNDEMEEPTTATATTTVDPQHTPPHPLPVTTTTTAPAVSFVIDHGEENDEYVEEEVPTEPAPPLHIEVLQDGNVRTDIRSHDELLRQVANLCIAVQGSLLTREVSFNDLAEVERLLKSCLATCNSHGLRKSGYPIELLSVVNREDHHKNKDDLRKCVQQHHEDEDDEEPQSGDEEGRTSYIVADQGQLQEIFHYDVHDEDDNEKDVVDGNDGATTLVISEHSESPLIYMKPTSPYTSNQYCFKTPTSINCRIDGFITKTCSEEALHKMRNGHLLGIHDLNLPETLLNYDRDILECNLDEVLACFDQPARVAVSEFVERRCNLLKCVMCGEIRNTDVLVCNSCFRTYHVSCIDSSTATQLSDVVGWNCADCCLHPS